MFGTKIIVAQSFYNFKT